MPNKGAHRYLLLLILSLIVCTFCSSFSSAAAANGGGARKNHRPIAFIVGTVYCDTCFQQEHSKSSHLISGASVAVECGSSAAAENPSFRKEVITNRYGVFRVRLPAPIYKHTSLVESCSLKLIKSHEPFCAVSSSAAKSSTGGRLRLRSSKNGVHVFSAGFFTFKPLKQPELCNQKPVLGDRKVNQPAFFFPSPGIPFLQPPNIGGVPLPPNPFQPPSLPNPLQPPPSLFPPLPLQPPAPPALNLPGLPLLTPPPPPPAIIPGFPFPPNPFFPGVPPAFHSKATP